MAKVRCPRSGHPAPAAKTTGRGMPKVAECPMCGGTIPVRGGLFVQHMALSPLPGHVTRRSS